jgi:ABC-type multidrug transport system fused ATPase/permease subunit
MLNITTYYKNNKAVVIKLVLITFTIGIFDAAGIFAIIPYVDVMFGQENQHSEFVSRILNFFPILQDKTNITLFFLSFYLIRGLILAALIHKMQMIFAKTNAKLLSELYHFCFDSDVYSQEQSSKLIRIHTRDSLVFLYAFLIQASVLITELIIFVFLFFGIIFYQPEAILLFPIIVFLVSLGYYLIKKRVSIWSKEVQTYDSRMIKYIQESHKAHDEISVYQSFSGFKDRIENVFIRKTLAYSKTESLMQMPRIMLETILVVLVVFTIYYITQIYSGVIQQSVAIFIILAGFRFLPMANRITQSLGWFRNGLVALEELNRIFKYPRRNFQRNISKYNSSFESARTAVVLKNVVSNIFEKKENKKLHNFDINYGELTCIIGETGSGKTTLLKQIAGVIDVQGQIIFKSVKQDSKESPTLSYVPQAPSIINASVKSNIIFFRNTISDIDEINEALSVVKLKKRVLTSDNGVETILSESGSNLSGGEKYRVCLARALLNKPHILIMDEPTSSLDKTTSIEVIHNLKSYLPDAAIIISSHDEDIIKISDKVIAL